MRLGPLRSALIILLISPAAAIAACPAGSIEVASAEQALRPVCARPVVGLNSAERAQVPDCGAGTTLMRTDAGVFLCFASERVTADAKPVCFGGGRPIALAGGDLRCRRRVTGSPDLRLGGSLKAFTRPDGGLIPSYAEQGASVQVVVLNAGTATSGTTKVSMRFPADFPYRNIFTFLEQPCPSSTRPERSVCVLAAPTDGPATLGRIGRSASCTVPPLAPGDFFSCFAAIGRTTKLAGGLRTDLVAFIEIAVVVNEDRAQGESDFSNNTGRLSDRLRD
jgi:hypothetical protein